MSQLLSSIPHIARFLCIIALMLLPEANKTYAIYNPLSVPNNQYGIHVADPNDIEDTAHLVNSNGGDWGYVTLVIQDNDMNKNKWQDIFSTMRRLHLIPIVRIATHVEGDIWVKPQEVNIDKWADFLDSLNWPVENRYVVIFNEPNHAKEWDGTIDPQGYGSILMKFAGKLKSQSDDFFILPAGLDASASTDGEAMDETIFLDRMIVANPRLLDAIDGWTSHSYPNPGFSGSPNAFGRGTMRTYDWELSILRGHGLTKELPVFITETGWVHSQGVQMNPKFLSDIVVARNSTTSAYSVWNDSRVAAVTPFVFNYQDVPFDHFSWKTIGGGGHYAHYGAYQAIPKEKGLPRQKERYELIRPLLPSTLVADSTYTLRTHIRNLGQGILDASNGYEIKLDDVSGAFTFFADPAPYLEPDQEGVITIHVKTPKKTGSYDLSVVIRWSTGQRVVEETGVTIIPPPSITIRAKVGWLKTSNATNAIVLIYDTHDTLIHKFTGITLANGETIVDNLHHIVPGNRYRIVLVFPYYLPRQTIAVLQKDTTAILFKRLLPLDFNNDGALRLNDIPALLQTRPHEIFSRFFGL